jgi:2',3'-cyclic-nucleotide 2'-phosphodiesterase (5'-nucleotidase family)
VLPPALPGTALRVLATNDLGVTLLPVPTSFGHSGTCAGVVELLERERERQPTIWLDGGDFAFGPVLPLLGRPPWEEVARLPIAAAAVGNHDLDDGEDALRAAAEQLPFPLLCANLDVGLPGSALVETGAGPVGVIGLTSPYVDRLSAGSRAPADVGERVAELARELGRAGVRWIVGIQHEGAAWWPSHDGGGVEGRPDRWDAVAGPLAGCVDLLLGGHVLGGWWGRVLGTPAGHAAAFESSLLVADLPAAGGPATVRGVFRVPPREPAERTPGTDAVRRAAERVVGTLDARWLARPGAAHYLPQRVADALRASTGAQAGLALGGQHLTQAPLDGATAALGPGPVTELDLLRLFPYEDDRPVVVELGSGELRAAIAAHDAITDPASRDGDHVWWNAVRMPAGVSATVGDPASVAVMPFVLGRLGELLGRELDGVPSAIGGREAVTARLRPPEPG